LPDPTQTSPLTAEGARADSVRVVGFWGVFSIAAGAMISSGLFVLPGLAYAKAGPAMILSYGLAALVVLPDLFSKAELCTAMPKAGGNYFFIHRSLGPLFGSVAGFADWFSVLFKATFAIVGLAALGGLLLGAEGAAHLKTIGIACCAFFALVNLIGAKESGGLQVLLVAGLLAAVAFYVVAGFPHVDGPRYLPFAPAGWQAVFMVTGMVAVSYGGLTKVAAISEEVENPTRNIPYGMLLAYIVVSVLYVLVVFVTVGVVPGEELAGSLTPLTLGAGKTAGRLGGLLVDAGAFLAFATTANAGIMAASRAPLAMSRDGLIPACFARTLRGRGTPVVAIVVTAAAMGAVLAFLSVEDLVKTASTMMILMFMLVNISIIVLRESGLENYRPTFRAPLYPWLQVAAIAAYAFLIFEMGRVPLLLTLGFILASVFWYFGYVHRRIDQQSALLFLVKRIVSRHIKRARLDEELVQIVLERDNISFDRFDRLVQACPVLDIEEPIGVRDLFRRVAEALPRSIGLTSEHLYELFLEREREGSTVLRPGLAIPHVIVPGERIFELVLVRCGPGITFSELHAPVRTAFVLVGSTDERNYHLRALMSIAHIVQEPDFETRWFGAGSVAQMRDMLLLSGRRRDVDAPSS